MDWVDIVFGIDSINVNYTKMSDWQQNYNKTTQPAQGWKTPSRSSPQGGGTRGCLCKNENKYSRKCCDGSLWAQGIGNITRSPVFTNEQWQGINVKWEEINETWNNNI
jgi:hypothetical protein